MNMTSRFSMMPHLFVTLLVAGLMLAVAPLRATTVAPANILSLVEKSSAGFQGVVASIEEIDTGYGKAEKITVKITEAISGVKSDQSTLTWTQFKGTDKIRVPGMPVYANGQEVIVFLSGKAEGSIFQAPIALTQGVFGIVRDEANDKTYAANAFNNSSLLQNVDVEKMTAAIVEQKSYGKNLSDAEKTSLYKSTATKVSSLNSRLVEASDIIDIAREVSKMDQPSKALATDPNRKTVFEPAKPGAVFPVE